MSFHYSLDFPVPLTTENDPVNILLRPFDPIPTETRRGEEDAFWKMVNGDLDLNIKAHEEMQRRADADQARLDSLDAQRALMSGGADGEVIYESLVRPTRAVAKGEFPLMKMSSSSFVSSQSTTAAHLVDKPAPKVAQVPPKPAPKEEPKPPAQIEHKLDDFTKGLMQNSNFHIHRTRHDPINLYWSMK